MAIFSEPNERKKIKQVQRQQADANNFLNKAIKYQVQGDLKNAEKNYRAAIGSGLSNVAIFSNLGIICQATQRTKEAIKYYKKAIAICPNCPDPFTNLGSLYKDLGILDKALSSTLKSLELQPDNHIAHMNLGVIYKDLGKLDQALAFTLKSLELNPDNPEVHMNLGSLYKDLGKLDQALASNLKSLDLKPDNPDTLMNLGGVYRGLGNLDKALASTLKSLELKPDNPGTLMNLGGIYKDLGNLDLALASVLKSLELDHDNPIAHMNLGGIYKDLGNLDQAVTSTLKSLELKPDNAIAHTNLGIYYEILNELDSALASYTQSIRLIAQHKDQSCLTNLISSSIILLQMNKKENAKKVLAKALEIAENKEINLKLTSKENYKHDRAYLNYLSKLIPEIPDIKAISESQILHLGESHCLTFTNQIIELKGEKCTVKPSLIKGAKAFHLNDATRANPQRLGFENRLQQNLDSYKHIFLSFGEIDCRENEGILLHCRKTGKAIQDVAKLTAMRYFKWTAKSLARQKEKLVYFGTPAPSLLDPNSEESLENNNERLLATRIFNITLAIQCQTSGVLFADVYKLTSGNDGYNSGKWMIDSRHLKPEALSELFKKIQY